MKKKFVYEHGLPFSQDLSIDLDDQIARIKSNKASLIIIDGGVGQGKTTLATHVADYVQGQEIDFETQLGLGGNDFMTKLKVCFDKKLVVVIYDEAGDFSSRGALTKFNHMLNRVFETYRTFKVLVILCLPLFAVLDKSLFHKRIPRLLIHLEERNDNYGNYKVYSLWHMWYLFHKMKKLVVPTDAFRYTEPCRYGHFLDLPKKRADELDKISTKNKADILGQADVGIKGLMNFTELGARIGRSKGWVQKETKKLNLKAVKLFRNQKYFDESALLELSNAVDGYNKNMGVEL